MLWVGVASAAGPDLRDAVGAVVERYADAVVPIRIVVAAKISYQGRELPSREMTMEVLGVALNEAGIIVTSSAAADPTGAGQRIQPGMEVESEVKSVKLIRPDGTELALEVVLRDNDLDLMFLRPKEHTDLRHVGLEGAGPELELMDELIVLSRLGPVGDRQPAVGVTRVQSVIDKPRRLYVTDLLYGMTGIGCPVFTLEGEFAGVVVLRMKPGGATGPLGGLGQVLLPVVLPAADVLEDMDQIEEPEEPEEEEEAAGAEVEEGAEESAAPPNE